jgi:hypothetical protein
VRGRPLRLRVLGRPAEGDTNSITTPWSTGLLGVAVDLLPGHLPPALVVQADLVRANPVSLEEMARVDRESYS